MALAYILVCLDIGDGLDNWWAAPYTWPYVGLGSGGLPRCGYVFSGTMGAPAASPYQQPPYPFYGGAPSAPGYRPFASQMTKEEELNFLKGQAEALKGQLEQIESRMRELESEE